MVGSKYLLLMVALLAAVALTGCIGSPKVFKPLAGCPDAEFVRIPSMMAKLAAPGYGVKTVEVANLGESVPAELISKTITRIVESKKMEMLVESHDDDTDAQVYAVVTDGDSPKIKKLLVVSREPGETSLVYLEGNIKLSDVMKEGKSDVGSIIGKFR